MIAPECLSAIEDKIAALTVELRALETRASRIMEISAKNADRLKRSRGPACEFFGELARMRAEAKQIGAERARIIAEAERLYAASFGERCELEACTSCHPRREVACA